MLSLMETRPEKMTSYLPCVLVGSFGNVLQCPPVIAPFSNRVALIFAKSREEVAVGVGMTELTKNSYETLGMEPISKIRASQASAKVPLL